MTIGKTIAAALSLVALGSASAARAAGDACLTPADLDAILVYALPTVIDATGQACRPVLARDGFLATQGLDLAARYRTAQPAAWPLARAAVLKVGIGALAGKAAAGGLGKFASVLPDGALQGFASGFVSQFVVQAVHPNDCPDIEYGLRMIAPLPPENAAGLITLVTERLQRRHVEGGARPALPLCPLQPVAPAPAPVLAPAPGQSRPDH